MLQKVLPPLIQSGYVDGMTSHIRGKEHRGCIAHCLNGAVQDCFCHSSLFWILVERQYTWAKCIQCCLIYCITMVRTDYTNQIFHPRVSVKCSCAESTICNGTDDFLHNSQIKLKFYKLKIALMKWLFTLCIMRCAPSMNQTKAFLGMLWEIHSIGYDNSWRPALNI